MAAGTRKQLLVGLDPRTIAAAIALAVVVPVMLLVWSAVALASGDSHGGPFATTISVITGQRAWPGRDATLILAGETAGLTALGLGLLVVLRRVRGRRSRADAAAARMGRGRDLYAMTPQGARESARRLLGDAAGDDPRGHGTLIGLTVAGNVPLRASWEDAQIVIAGTRTMKTTTQVIPCILDAPGAALVTSNKRDVTDAVRGPRATVGEVWVFDPQQLVGEPVTWWWNPLAALTSVTAARKLASHFASGSRPSDARRDAFFDPAGEELLANLLLAAACSSRTVLDVYEWITDPIDRAPVEALRGAGHRLSARAVLGVIESPEKLRGSIYATAQQMASCLIEPSVTRWVTPGGSAREFRPTEFAMSRDTLSAVSREGEGTAAPLVTGLVAAVLEAAELRASTSPRGRLPLPLLAVLDEAANVCRIRELPNLYSHYGSRGIVLKTILQSWSQGEEAWGPAGIKKMWAASNIRLYGGGGGGEDDYLERLSKIIGQHDATQHSTTWSQDGRRSVQQSVRREHTLDVAELAALPRFRAVVIASGMPATLVRPVPWWEGEHADAIRASLAQHDPGWDGGQS